jgi:hypothetical protein
VDFLSRRRSTGAFGLCLDPTPPRTVGQTERTINVTFRILISAVAVFALGFVLWNVSRPDDSPQSVLYQNQKYGFLLTLPEAFVEGTAVREENGAVYFVSKAIQDTNPGSPYGVVGRIEIFPKAETTMADLKEREEMYNLKYLGRIRHTSLAGLMPATFRSPSRQQTTSRRASTRWKRCSATAWSRSRSRNDPVSLHDCAAAVGDRLQVGDLKPKELTLVPAPGPVEPGHPSRAGDGQATNVSWLVTSPPKGWMLQVPVSSGSPRRSNTVDLILPSSPMTYRVLNDRPLEKIEPARADRVSRDRSSHPNMRPSRRWP